MRVSRTSMNCSPNTVWENPPQKGDCKLRWFRPFWRTNSSVLAGIRALLYLVLDLSCSLRSLLPQGGLWEASSSWMILKAERRQWTLPEEELPPCITARRQPGEHRWFRSLRPIGGGRWTYGPRQAGGPWRQPLSSYGDDTELPNHARDRTE